MRPSLACGGDDENADTSSKSSVAAESAKNVTKRGHHERTLSVGYASSGTPRVDLVGWEGVMLRPSVTPLDKVSSDGLKGPTGGAEVKSTKSEGGSYCRLYGPGQVSS